MTMRCPHCAGEITSPAQSHCEHCLLKLETVEPLPVLVAKSKDRRGTERTHEWNEEGIGKPAIGIDPGSRNTAIVIRDGDKVILASTYVRQGDLDPVAYAFEVVDYFKTIRDDYPLLPIGLEGITDPKGFNRGKRAAINPKDIIRTGVVVGAIAAVWRADIIMIPPGGNGSQDISQYPASLQGRRPKTLLGNSHKAGTRRHEQSAFDVAGKASDIYYEKRPV